MALQAGFRFLSGKVGRLESEDIGSAAFLDMFLGSGVARGAAGRSDRRVGLLGKAFDDVLMALAAGLGVLSRLLDGLGGRQESGGKDSQYEEPERLDGQSNQHFLSFRWQLRPPLISLSIYGIFEFRR
jgi:hypothetical protein